MDPNKINCVWALWIHGIAAEYQAKKGPNFFGVFESETAAMIRAENMSKSFVGEILAWNFNKDGEWTASNICCRYTVSEHQIMPKEQEKELKPKNENKAITLLKDFVQEAKPPLLPWREDTPKEKEAAGIQNAAPEPTPYTPRYKDAPAPLAIPSNGTPWKPDTR